jgi:AcrR family transcriptional regulator
VDAALVHHYFGNKEELFAAAVRLPLQPSEALAPILEGGVEQMGGRLARLFFTIWEAAESREALLAQLRHAMTEQGQAIPLAEFVSNAVLPRLVPHLTGPERKLRLELAASHLVGLAILRYVVRLEPVASAPVTKLIEEVAPRVQGYLSGGP